MQKNVSIRRLIVSTSLVISASLSYGQNYFYKTFNWEKQPTVSKPTESEKLSEINLIKDFTAIETAYDKDGQAVIYETHHRIYHVNTAKGIERVNKIFISTSQVNEELDLKARCITSENKVIAFNADNVKHIDNYEESGPYTIFSIDGVDVGCDVEYYYTNKRVFYPYALYRINNGSPIRKYEFVVFSPKNLVYETKSYNGLSQFVKDTTDKNRNIVRLEQNNIPEIDDEKYSADDANKMCFVFQLAYNTDKSNSKFYTWETIAKGYYNNLFVLEKNEQKAIEKLLDKNKITKLSTPLEKVSALENLLKLDYNISEGKDDYTLVKAIDSKKMSEGNALRVFIGAFKLMDIPFELVLAADRMKVKFDGKFPTYTFLDDILFYFPGISKCMSPTNFSSRIDFANPNNMYTEGLFIKEIMVGDIGAPSSKIKSIPANDYTKSYHNTNVKVKINPSTLVSTLDVTQSLAGYPAYYIQPVYYLLNDEQKKEVQKSYFLFDKPDLAKNIVVKNVAKEDILVKPFEISFTQELPDAIESAGEKFIFKVGDLIGQQSELYQEKKRVYDGDIYYTHFFKRTLEVTIPEGYKITNADEIKIDKKCVVDGKEVSKFTSEYKIEGDKMIITVYEDYQVINYPLANFDGFKGVINAAADFNKKTLVFEKK